MSTFLSWNVNGYRAIVKKGLFDILDVLDADLICFQETKAQPEQIELDPELYPYQYKYSAQRKGYSGTMIASRVEPLEVYYGLGIEELDTEGRVIRLEFDEVNVITVYTPNSGEGLKRAEFRQRWDAAFSEYLEHLEKPFLLCGDMNVAHQAIDIYDEAAGQGSAGYTDYEKAGFERHLNSAIDAYRLLYPDRVQYTWWSYFGRDRDHNRGWRIDYWLVSPSLKEKIRDVIIYDDIFGSDHCPILLDMDLKL